MARTTINFAMRYFLLSSLVLLIPSGSALAQRRGFLYGWSDTIVHVRDLPADLRAELKKDTKLDLAVGFYYRHWFLFGKGFDFWTWDGKFVLFQGDKYYPVSPDNLEKWLGKDEFEALSTPFLYRFPAGILTVLGIIAVIVVWVRFFPPAQTRARRLSKDPLYQQAMEVYERILTEKPDARADAQAETVTFLENQGVPRDKAETNLRLLLAEADRELSYELRNQAVVFEEAGEWDSAISLYQQAARLREQWDPKDHAFLLTCVQRVQTKQAAEPKPEETNENPEEG